MRFFNTAGPINTEDHYYIPLLERFSLEDVLILIKQKKYFLLHAPRQTGKTSCLLALMKYLNELGIYKCLYVNIEVAQAMREDYVAGNKYIANAIAQAASMYLGDNLPKQILAELSSLDDGGRVEVLLSNWANQSELPIILFLDEVDALVGDTLISLLRQLRAGYNRRPQRFPQSVLLCGVRDIHDYRIHSDKEKAVITGGSAFNIKAESLKLGNFSKKDIEVLYQEHTKETGQVFSCDIYDLVWDLTAGQPWLVNALAYEVCFKMKEGKDRSAIITRAMIEEAKENLIRRRETHLDQLVDKLQEDRVRRVIAPILAGEENGGEFKSDDVEYVKDLGLIKEAIGGKLSIANKIYQEVIPRELVINKQRAMTQETVWYVLPDGRIDIAKLLTNFQQFFRENADSWIEKWDYKEAGPQLLMQAFLQRILNGGGQIEREYALGRKRTDLFIKWYYTDITAGSVKKEQKEVIELKIVHAKSLVESVIAEGLLQIAEYMAMVGVDSGNLVVFDRRIGRSWDEKVFREIRQCGDKKIEVWGM